MFGYLMSLLGLTLLCAGWMVFQLWLKKQDPERENYRPGCGACKKGSCSAPADTKTISPENIRHN